jgi:hypothetical protein
MTVIAVAAATLPSKGAITALCVRALRALALHDPEVPYSAHASIWFPGHPGDSDLTGDHIAWALTHFQQDTRYNFRFLGPLDPTHNCNWPRFVTKWRSGEKRFLGVGVNIIGARVKDQQQGHWVSFLADWQNKTLEFFDPMGQMLSLYVLVAPVFHTMHAALEAFEPSARCGPNEQVWTLDTGAKRRHQEGVVECGMFNLWFFSSRLHGTSLPDLHATRFPDEVACVLRDVYFSDRKGLRLQGPGGVPPEKQLLDPRTLQEIVQPAEQHKSMPVLSTVDEDHRYRGLPTGGNGNCAFHAAFGTWKPGPVQIFFAVNNADMRACFSRFLAFFKSIDEMHPTLREYAKHTLADFYNMGELRSTFVPSRELQAEIAVHRRHLDVEHRTFTQEAERIIQLARLHAGLQDANGMVIIELVGAELLAVTAPTSEVHPIAAHMRETFAYQMPREGEWDRETYFQLVCGNKHAEFWEILRDWENGHTQHGVDMLFRNILEKVRLSLPLHEMSSAATQFEAALPDAAIDEGGALDAILRLPRFWQEFASWARGRSYLYFLSTGDLGFVSELSRRTIRIHYPKAPTPTVVYTPTVDGSGLRRTGDGESTTFVIAPGTFPVGDEICEIAHNGSNHYTRFGLPEDMPARRSSPEKKKLSVHGSSKKALSSSKPARRGARGGRGRGWKGRR